MVLGKLPVPGVLLIRIKEGQGPTELTAGAGGGCFGFFSLVFHFSVLSPSFWRENPSQSCFFFQLFCSRGCSYTKCLGLKKEE